MGVKLDRYEFLIARIKEDLAFKFFPNNSAAGEDYHKLKHTLRVYDQIMAEDTEFGGYPRTRGEQLMAGVVALLHDVPEHSSISIGELTGLYQYDLERAFFDVQGVSAADVFDALAAITLNPDEKYAEYLKRVSSNELATYVKVYTATDIIRYGAKLSNDSLVFRATKALAVICDNAGETVYA